MANCVWRPDHEAPFSRNGFYFSRDPRPLSCLWKPGYGKIKMGFNMKVSLIICLLLKMIYLLPTQLSLLLLNCSAAKPDPFFWVQSNFGPNFVVQTDRVGPRDPKTGPIRSGWPQIRVRIRVQPSNVPNKPDLNENGSGWALRVQNWVESDRVGPQGQNSGRVGRVHLAALHCTTTA